MNIVLRGLVAVCVVVVWALHVWRDHRWRVDAAKWELEQDAWLAGATS